MTRIGARVADVVACTETGPLVLGAGPPALRVLERWQQGDAVDGGPLRGTRAP